MYEHTVKYYSLAMPSNALSLLSQMAFLLGPTREQRGLFNRLSPLNGQTLSIKQSVERGVGFITNTTAWHDNPCEPLSRVYCTHRHDID